MTFILKHGFQATIILWSKSCMYLKKYNQFWGMFCCLIPDDLKYWVKFIKIMVSFHFIQFWSRDNRIPNRNVNFCSFRFNPEKKRLTVSEPSRITVACCSRINPSQIYPGSNIVNRFCFSIWKSESF